MCARNNGFVQVGAQARPLGAGELLLDCFELATDARRLDMEASPMTAGDLASTSSQWRRQRGKSRMFSVNVRSPRVEKSCGLGSSLSWTW